MVAADNVLSNRGQVSQSSTLKVLAVLKELGALGSGPADGDHQRARQQVIPTAPQPGQFSAAEE